MFQIERSSILSFSEFQMVYTLQVLTERASNERPARRSILVNEPVQVKERETIHYRDVTHLKKK